jgi:hypothetical protein
MEANNGLPVGENGSCMVGSGECLGGEATTPPHGSADDDPPIRNFNALRGDSDSDPYDQHLIGRLETDQHSE